MRLQIGARPPSVCLLDYRACRLASAPHRSAPACSATARLFWFRLFYIQLLCRACSMVVFGGADCSHGSASGSDRPCAGSTEMRHRAVCATALTCAPCCAATLCSFASAHARGAAPPAAPLCLSCLCTPSAARIAKYWTCKLSRWEPAHTAYPDSGVISARGEVSVFSCYAAVLQRIERTQHNWGHNIGSTGT